MVPMVYNNPCILIDQISGIFKGTWEIGNFEQKIYVTATATFEYL